MLELLKSLPFLDPIFSDARGNLHLLPHILSSLGSKAVVRDLIPLFHSHFCLLYCLLFLHLVLTYAAQAVFSPPFSEFLTQMILSILHYFTVLGSELMYPAKTHLHSFATGTYQMSPLSPTPMRSQTRLWVQNSQERNKVPFLMKLLLQKKSRQTIVK